MADTDTRKQWLEILEKAGFNEHERLVIERLSKPYIAAKEREARLDEEQGYPLMFERLLTKEYMEGLNIDMTGHGALDFVKEVSKRRIAALRGEAPASGEQQNGDPGGFDKRHVVPKLNATKSMPSVSYSHPLTEEEKEKVDKFIDSIKRRKDNA